MKSTFLLTAVLLSLTSLCRANPEKTIKMAIPGVKGLLEIDAGPTSQTRVRPDGKEVQLRAFDRPDHLEITAFLQRVAFPASPERCREEWWPGTKGAVALQHDDLQDSAVKDGIARVEYIIPEFKGIKVRQKNVHAYLGSGDLCAEIHLSKAGFNPQDQKLFEDLLSSVRLIPDQETSPGEATSSSHDHDSKYYFGQGSRAFLQQDYSTAAGSYQKALDLEKQKRTLSKDNFRVLVDNLGMSYGMGHKLAEAKAIFEYGLTQDPEYPMFYYNMACVAGEKGKMGEALEQLKLFYKYKANMIQGESLPDPLTDDSFRNFVDDPKFVKEVHGMQK